MDAHETITPADACYKHEDTKKKICPHCGERYCPTCEPDHKEECIEGRD